MNKYTVPALMVIALSSCGIYRQNVVNVPLLQQKGQAQAGGHISFNGCDAQASYAVTNKIGMMANYSDMGSRKEVYTTKSNSVKKHYFGEIGVGMYKKTKKEKINEMFFLAGKGMTSRTNTYIDTAGTISIKTQRVKYSRFLVQGDFGGTQKKWEGVVSPRLFFIHYYDIKDDFRSDYRDLLHSYIYTEAALTLRYQLLQYIIISGQSTFTYPLSAISENGFNYYYEFAPFNFSIGLVFNLNLLKTKHTMTD